LISSNKPIQTDPISNPIKKHTIVINLGVQSEVLSL
jgi:hypothetical protein